MWPQVFRKLLEDGVQFLLAPLLALLLVLPDLDRLLYPVDPCYSRLSLLFWLVQRYLALFRGLRNLHHPLYLYFLAALIIEPTFSDLSSFSLLGDDAVHGCKAFFGKFVKVDCCAVCEVFENCFNREALGVHGICGRNRRALFKKIAYKFVIKVGLDVLW